MTFPYFRLPIELHDRLGEILERGGPHAVKEWTDFEYPPGISGPQPADDPTYKCFLISEGTLEVSVSSSFKPIFGYHTAYVLLREGKRREGKPLLERIERLLEEHGAVKE